MVFTDGGSGTETSVTQKLLEVTDVGGETYTSDQDGYMGFAPYTMAGEADEGDPEAYKNNWMW